VHEQSSGLIDLSVCLLFLPLARKQARQQQLGGPVGPLPCQVQLSIWVKRVQLSPVSASRSSSKDLHLLFSMPFYLGYLHGPVQRGYKMITRL